MSPTFSTAARSWVGVPCREASAHALVRECLGRILAAYLLSPIDLIPDFVPVLGHLDYLVVISLGVLVIRRLVPADVMEECRKRAVERFAAGQPVSKSAAIVVVFVWIGALVLAGAVILRMVR